MFYPFIIKANDIEQLQLDTQTTIRTDENKEDILKISQLRAYLSTTDGLINGKTLKDLWFPQGKYQIFLSHSHGDIDKARYLKAWFKIHCDLDCFIDADVWENAYVLLRELDDRIKHVGAKNYNYEQRNRTTAHVYSMLTMALFEAIDEIECPILIESTKSVPLDDGIKQGTLSPWIYEEVGYMGKLPHKIPERFANTGYFSVGSELVTLNESIQDSMQMSHPLDTITFKKIERSDLSAMIHSNGTNALNVLYMRKLLLKPYRRV